MKRPSSSPVSSKNTDSKPSPRNPSARSPRPSEDSATNRRGATNTKLDDLPPNENLRKHADEAYGDTEIPERKEE